MKIYSAEARYLLNEHERREKLAILSGVRGVHSNENKWNLFLLLNLIELFLRHDAVGIEH
jgi:hypothetical protein